MVFTKRQMCQSIIANESFLIGRLVTENDIPISGGSDGVFGSYQDATVDRVCC